MNSNPVYTIGYGARAMGDFMTLLKAHNIAYLIDVRSEPYSQYKPEFSKDALTQQLNKNGIKYVFMGDTLGGRPSDPSCYREGKIVYGEVEKRPFYQKGIARLQSAHGQGLPVALMCSEGKPEQCHRSRLIGETLLGAGIPIAHIDENGELRTQEEVRQRTQPSQQQPSSELVEDRGGEGEG